jgi:hypothetical protein
VDGEAARKLLIHAFADEIVSRCGIAPLRDRLQRLLTHRLVDAGVVGALS